MQNFEQNANSRDKLSMLIGSIAGGAISFFVIRSLPPIQAAVGCSFVTACLALACTQLSQPILWWTVVGAIAGITMGTSGVLAESLAQAHAPLEFRVRCTIVGLQSFAGLIAGMLLGRKIHNPHVPSLKSFLSRLGALTTGIFAVTVTTKFIFAGLEEARSFSSRLSTSSTMLITAFVVPGVIGYLLTERRTDVKRSRTSESE